MQKEEAVSLTTDVSTILGRARGICQAGEAESTSSP